MSGMKNSRPIDASTKVHRGHREHLYNDNYPQKLRYSVFFTIFRIFYGILYFFGVAIAIALALSLLIWVLNGGLTY